MILEGRCVTSNGIQEGQIAFDPASGLIQEVGALLGKPDLTTDGMIFPGFCDLHVHAREDVSGTQNYKEDFRTMSEAALHGGVVAVGEMPNNPVPPIDAERYEAKKRLTRSSSVDVVLYAGIGPGTHPLPYPVPYKAYMGPSVGDLFFTSAAQFEATIARYRGQSVCLHCEDPEVLGKNKGAATHEARRPAEAEVSAVVSAIQLIERYALQGRICHLSTAEGLTRVAAAKQKGIAVTCEVSPLHLFFDETMLTPENRVRLQMNPPVRSPRDRMALIEGIRDGTVDYLATDHAPHTWEEKRAGTSGTPQLDTYGLLAVWLMQEHGILPERVATLCSTNPAAVLNAFLPEGRRNLGKIQPGGAASLTILNVDRPTTVSRETLRTKCGWSPFESMTFPGRVEYTMVRGKIFSQPQSS